jgi:hypothetical protein
MSRLRRRTRALFICRSNQAFGVLAETVGPAETDSEVADAEARQSARGVIEPVILVVNRSQIPSAGV